MLQRLWFLALVFTCCSACVSGLKSKTVSKREQRIPWHEERLHHTGLGLTDVDLQKIAAKRDEAHFEKTLAQILIPRVVDTPGHAKVRKFIVSELQQLGWTVELHAFEDQTPVGTKTFTNVIATLNPSATRRLVLACHYDSKLTPIGFLGATDSAVPCSMLINLAHTLGASLADHRAKRKDLTLQFLFIDGEEAFKSWTGTDSLYGARKLARDLHSTPYPLGGTKDTTQLHRIDLFVLLDLIGTEDVRFYSLFKDSEPWYSRLASFERRMMKQGLLSQRPYLFRDQSNYFASIEDDHVPFLKRGVPILHLISAPFPSVWHEMSDNRESLHSPSIENMNTLMRAFVADYLHLNVTL